MARLLLYDMSDSDKSETEVTSISAQVDEKFVNEFDRAIKKAQIEGEIPMKVSRSQVIRGLMKLASEDTDLIAAAVKEDNIDE